MGCDGRSSSPPLLRVGFTYTVPIRFAPHSHIQVDAGQAHHSTHPLSGRRHESRSRTR